MVAPKLAALVSNVSVAVARNFTSTLIALIEKIARIVLWKFERGELWLSVEKMILEFVHTSDVSMTSLNY